MIEISLITWVMSLIPWDPWAVPLSFSSWKLDPLHQNSFPLWLTLGVSQRIEISHIRMVFYHPEKAQQKMNEILKEKLVWKLTSFLTWEISRESREDWWFTPWNMHDSYFFFFLSSYLNISLLSYNLGWITLEISISTSWKSYILWFLFL